MREPREKGLLVSNDARSRCVSADVPGHGSTVLGGVDSNFWRLGEDARVVSFWTFTSFTYIQRHGIFESDRCIKISRGRRELLDGASP